MSGLPFSGDVDSFERKQEIYMNASNELQRTKDKVQQLQVNIIYSAFARVQKLIDIAYPLSKTVH